MRRKGFLLVVLALVALGAGDAVAQDASVGNIHGRIVKKSDKEKKAEKGIGGVTILVQETKAVQISDPQGRYYFDNLPAGTYTLIFTMGDNVTSATGVEVGDGLTNELKTEVDWDVGLLERLTVYSASKRMEKIVDAPAAITVVPEEIIELEASSGQVPKLLEFTPGAEITQSGIYGVGWPF